MSNRNQKSIQEANATIIELPESKPQDLIGRKVAEKTHTNF